jgi:hypothetical protein
MNRTQLGLGAILVVGSGVVVFLALAAVGVLGRFSVDACVTGGLSGPAGQPQPPPFAVPVVGWGGFVVAVCTLGFIGGGVWGHERARGHVAARRLPTRAAPHTRLQVLLVALFGFGTLALGYETYAVAAGNSELWPITYFVRCANDVVSIPTLLGALLVSTLVGHWLGYEARVELED